MKAVVPDTGDEITNSLLEAAFHDGVDKARMEVLTFLEDQYMASDRPIEVTEKTPEEKAILEVAKSLGIFIRSRGGK